MASFEITRSKWRCGGNSQVRGHRLGKGFTELLNVDGYMCCLGQIAGQCGIGRKSLLNKATPAIVKVKRFPHLTRYSGTVKVHTKLSEDAMEINDDESTTVVKKEKLLTALFEKYGHKLTFID